jgi:hypothetical protein
MSILLNVLNRRNTQEEVVIAFRDYRAYLESVRSFLSPSGYEFASAPWHYDHNDHKCPHDSWVESLLIREPSSGTRHEVREIEIAIRLLGAFHDGYLELSYPGVHSYSITGVTGKPKIGHGDWLADEVRLSNNNLVLHEILFSCGGRWTIESRDIQFRWVHI